MFLHYSLRFTLVLLLLFITTSVNFAQKLLLLDDSHTEYGLEPYIVFFEDTTNNYSIETMMQQRQTLHFAQANEQGINFGVSKSAFWLRMRVINGTSSAQKHILLIEDPTHYLVECYVTDTSKVLSYQRSGAGVDNSDRTVKGNQTAFVVQTLPYQNYFVWLRVQSNVLITLPVNLVSDETFYNSQSAFRFGYGLFYGIVLVIFFYNLSLFFFTREWAFLYYIFYVLFFGIFLSWIDGFGFEYWRLVVEITGDRQLVFSATLFLIFSSLFARAFLHTKSIAPLADKLLKASIVLYGVCFVINIFSPLAARGMLMYLYIVYILLFVMAGVSALLKGSRPARFFIIAYSFFIVAFVIVTLMNFGFLPANWFTFNVWHIGSAAEFIGLSLGLGDKINLLNKEKNIALEEKLKESDKVFVLNKQIEKYNAELEQTIVERTATIRQQNELIAKKNQNITASINYAGRIQRALLPFDKRIKQAVEEYFIFYRPRDIVSGDFYWFETIDDCFVIAVVDCTGHGVPGAFMTMLGQQALMHIVLQRRIVQPDAILAELSSLIRYMLKQEVTHVNDGMDIALCVVCPQKNTLQYAGAKNPLIYFANQEMHVVKANAMSIGGVAARNETFTCHTIEYTQPTMLYLFTDGVHDQFGGNDTTKYSGKRFRDMLTQIHQLPVNEQQQIIEQSLTQWMGNTQQTDDMLAMGMRLYPR